MKTQEIIIAHPKTADQVSALKAFMQALKIRFDVSEEENYNPEFVEKVLESRKQAREGKVTRVERENLKQLI